MIFSSSALGWVLLTAVLILGLVLVLRAVARGRGRRARVRGGLGPAADRDHGGARRRPAARAESGGEGVPGDARALGGHVRGPFPSGLTTLRLMCAERGTAYPWVWCDVRKGRYPPLPTLPKHAPFWITGRIRRVDLNDIYLRDVRLEFGEEGG